MGRKDSPADRPDLAGHGGPKPKGAHLSCREFVAFLHDYLAGELPAATEHVFGAHLARCPSCVSYTNSYRETLRLGKAAFLCESDMPEDVPADLLRAILVARL